MNYENIAGTKQTERKREALPGLPPESAYESGLASDNHAGLAIDLNKELIYNRSATAFVRVRTDIMREAGIYKGDVLIVDQSVPVSNGQVIIAVLNGSMLIRRFEKTKNIVRLLVDSNQLSPIQLEAGGGDFTIWGVVTFVIHKP